MKINKKEFKKKNRLYSLFAFHIHLPIFRKCFIWNPLWFIKVKSSSDSYSARFQKETFRLHCIYLTTLVGTFLCDGDFTSFYMTWTMSEAFEIKQVWHLTESNVQSEPPYKGLSVHKMFSHSATPTVSFQVIIQYLTKNERLIKKAGNWKQQLCSFLPFSLIIWNHGPNILYKRCVHTTTSTYSPTHKWVFIVFMLTSHVFFSFSNHVLEVWSVNGTTKQAKKT